MNHAGHLSFRFCFYRQAVTSAPHGDDGILQMGAVAVQQIVHLTADFFICVFDGAADVF